MESAHTIHRRNRLAAETSPYLLQHAENPVDWYPWSEEAFETARREDKAIFLSIGYSTCHWCHVMAHESFEDPEVAELLNRYFVCIKVDREELPAVDEVYMRACLAINGHGGWPLTIFMTPDKVPFFAGTYFAKYSSPHRIGFLDLAERLWHFWSNSRADLLADAQRLVEHLQDAQQTDTRGSLRPTILTDALGQFKAHYDSQHPGFGSAPKFPMAHNFSFLLRHAKTHQDPAAAAMALASLRAMRLGGIYDQVGFGIHRYSTDAEWKVPHFEKMLYDQALAVLAYTDAYAYSQDPFYKQVAEEIISYVQRELVSPEGVFYSAQDADSEGVEGKYYVWTESELSQTLKNPALLNALQVERDGNFTEEASGHKTYQNILYLERPLPSDLENDWRLVRPQLLKIRQKRVPPGTDTKALTAWNALMISALCRAGQTFQNQEYLRCAQSAADFLLQNMFTEEGRLLRSFHQGKSQHLAVLEDHAFLTAALLDMYESTLESCYLVRTWELHNAMMVLFWDAEAKNFYSSGADAPTVLLRSKEFSDGALPAASSVAFTNLLRLGAMTGRPDLKATATALIESYAQQVNAQPFAFGQLLQGIDMLLGSGKEMVIAGRRDDLAVKEMCALVQSAFLPGRVLLFHPTDEPQDAIFKLCPWVADQKPLNGQVTAYVCQDSVCQKPVHTLQDLTGMIHH